MVKNIEIADQIIDMMQTLLDAEVQMYDYERTENKQENVKLYADCRMLLETIKQVCRQNEEKIYEELYIGCEDILYSFENCMKKFNIEAACQRIEFELIPMTKVVMTRFYFFATIYPDKIRMQSFYDNEMMELLKNPYLEESVESGEYKYDLSIIVIGYNKLEYTKLCVESLLKNLPENLKYEIILKNHGSSDGTKEYFESICSTKQIDIKVNGKVHFDILIYEGKYNIGISNDVIVTKNAIKNMYEYMEENLDVAWAVPSTSNISNYQTIPANYSNFVELELFATENNQKNLYRQEQRIRLCNPIDIKRSSVYFTKGGIGYGALSLLSDDLFSFPDDKQSLLLRRSGYKMVLMKNAYCHHFGSVTIKEQTDNNYYAEGRKNFKSTYGVDPWGTGFIYDAQLFEKLQCKGTDHVNILGINCGLGSNSLKIKEQIKENSQNFNANLHNLTSDKSFLQDLKGISDKADYFKSFTDMFEQINDEYDYIIIENPIANYEEQWWVIEELQKKLKTLGVFIINLNHPSKSILRKINKYKNISTAGTWYYWSKYNDGEV